MSASIAPRSYENTPPLKVAFIGLGAMGYPMAGHLVAAGHQVCVYNRSPEKASRWAAEFNGATAPTPALAAAAADIVFCCVGNDDDLRGVLTGKDGAFSGMKPGALCVDHTTASADVARELYDTARSAGLRFLDAPVSGGQNGAVQGVLTIMCGGDVDDFTQAEPIMQAYARATTYMGASGSGQLCKMVNQICVAGVLQGLSEAIAFGKTAGLNMEKVLSVISKGAAQSWQMENRGQTMVTNQFDFGFAVDWMRKDLGLVLDEARRNGASVPGTALIDQFYAEVQKMGGGRWDTSSLITRLPQPTQPG
ncbi:NAD(P)-dependent oxidoreductase [Pusillimonas minor]|uniref:NAD(P)-dependent oxidoreductase n=1 Tax=Pusillimonas minor TaxID=2697024 RepID=A0A842HUJ8_9BURK|nr:NAD(P)-dependent oxidoreductase [Pusillimonas minor]MBC2770871.1 NAD(P)-dependent oxidoreductase [Pusillimonas minor]